MPTILATMGIDESGDHSRLFLDFANSRGGGLLDWLPGVSAAGDYWLERARSAGPSRADARTAVFEQVHTLSAKLGTRGDVLDKIRPASSGESLVVVTGQQPGTLGGPLLALYKAVTAVALAARVEDTLARPCVPLFWCGGDDTDFQEIRSFSCLAADAMPFGSQMPQTAHTAGMPIGDVELRWPRGVWEAVERFADGFEHGAFLRDVIARAFERADDHGELSAAILVGLTGGGIAVVDGRSGLVRRSAQRLIAEYIEREDDVKSEIDAQGRRLEAAGYHAQLTTGADSGVFLLEDGIRKNVDASGRPRLIEMARNAVENCSPGVALRNLVQDEVFGPVAVVLGPAEVAYRAQLAGVYDRFGVAMPAVVPRMTATYIPPVVASVFGAADARDIRTALTEPAVFTKQVYERSIPEDTAAATHELHRRVNDAVDAFSRTLSEGGSAKALGKIRSRLDDLKKRTAQTATAVGEIGKASAVERWPFLPQLDAIVRPGGKPQDRSLSVLVPFLFGGDAMTADLIEAAGGYADDLLDGRTNHIVYSSK